MKFIVFFIAFFVIIFNSFSQGGKLKVYMDTKQYYEPTNGNFVEINFQFVGSSLVYLGAEDGLKGELAVILDILQQNDTILSDAYRLNSPIMRDSIVEDFYDIRRFALQPGNYDLKIKIYDLIKNDDPIAGSLSFIIDQKSENVEFGDIQNVEYAQKGESTSVFFKSGFEIIPRLSNYYPEQLTALPYYTEIYNTDKLGFPSFGLQESIYNVQSKKEMEEFTKIYHFDAKNIVPILKQIDISQLPTGNYYLELSVIDSKMASVVNNRYYFERTNNESFVLDENIVLDPSFELSIPKDSIEFYLASLLPIAKGQSAVTILQTLKEKNNEKSLKLLQSFWITTAKTMAYESWLKYKGQVLYTEQLFSNNFLRGYESDRGRVYLQYGAPNTVTSRENSQDNYPYEIWQYNQIGKFSNKNFVFYNPDLIANNYQLLHSDLIGEKRNMNWPLAIRYKDAFKGDTDNQNTGVPNTFQDQDNLLFRQRQF